MPTETETTAQAPPGSQELWQTLLAHIQEMIVLLDSDGAVSYANPAIERWLGYAPEDLIGRRLELLSHPDDSASLVAKMEDVAPGVEMSLEHRLQGRDGSWRWLESQIVCLRRNPLIGGVLLTCRDVTERVALERERERLDLDRRVSQRLEAVGQLAAGIAHEINTPLQFVGDSVTFLREAVDELVRLTGLYRETLYTEAVIPLEERRQMMREAEAEADVEYLCRRIPSAFARTADGIDRVRSIVMAMKRFSHASTMDLAPADINEAIKTTLAVCRNEYKYVATVALELGDLPLVVCNIGELNQVFLNLILNAAQAIEEKVAGSDQRGQIRIDTGVEGAEAVIRVADDGPGIPAELLDRIYEPFFTTKEVGKGTGQGLALARSTIARHAGTLECQSMAGEGTTFTIRVPLDARAPSTAEERERR
jgi:two-component system, NtrC family, sensor kinase